MSITKAVLMMWAILAMASGAYGQETDTEPPGPLISTLRLDPERPRTGDRPVLRLEVGEGTQRVEVRWVINGEEAALSDALEFPATVELESAIKAGDKIDITATPFGNQDEKGPQQTVHVVVRNAPPLMVLKNQRIEGHEYKADLKASDIEGKQVALTLKTGPPGMKIDPKGHISWKFDPETAGKFNIQISGKDEDGAEAILSYTFSIRRSPEKK
jgi:hypothetical protein